MKSLLTLIVLLALLPPTAVVAEGPISFEQAKLQSSQDGKPLLLEFFRED